MKNCSLDLCLSPMTSTVNKSLATTRAKETNAFYNGKVGEYDLVEIQIRAIIKMASKERVVTAVELAPPVRMESPLGFSVKRSVKKFLENRKKRSKSVVTPYISTSSSSSHHF